MEQLDQVLDQVLEIVNKILEEEYLDYICREQDSLILYDEYFNDMEG